MKLNVVAVLAGGAMCLGVPALAGAPPELPAPAAKAEAGAGAAAVSEPERVVDAFHAALRSGDQAAAAVLMTEAALIFEEGHVERSKAEYVQGHLPSDVAFAKATTHARGSRAAWSSGELAYVVSEGRTRGEFRGKPVDRLVVETMVLRRRPEGWRIAHIHWSSRAGGQ